MYQATMNGGIYQDEIKDPNKEPEWVAQLEYGVAQKVRQNKQQKYWNPDTNQFEQAPYLPIPEFQLNNETLKAPTGQTKAK